DPVRPPPRSFTEVSDPPTTSRNVRGAGRRGPGPPGLPRLDAPWVPRPPTRPAPAPRARGNGRRGSPSGTPRAGSPREGGGRPKRSPPLTSYRRSPPPRPHPPPDPGDRRAHP